MSWRQRLSWLRGFGRVDEPAGTRACRGRYRPQVLSLEGRCLPSTVTTLADSGPGSLRDALASTPAFGTVNFQPGLAGTVTLTSATLIIDHPLTVSGPGAKTLAVSGNQQFTVFAVASGATVTLAGLSIVNGHGTTGLGVNGGGGISNQGILTVTGCNISNNQDVNGHSAAYGGGIFNAGTLTVVASTLSHNSAVFAGGPFGPPSSVGGGIYNDTSATLTVVNSTLSGNSASASAAVGGGIANGGSLTLISSTLSLNAATGDSLATGGAISNAGTLNLINTLVAGNTARVVSGSTAVGPDVEGTVAQADHNLIGIGDGSTGLTNGQNGNQVGTAASPLDAKLGPLQDNGGPTPTHALLAGSPAIDAGTNAASPGATDQRGLPRIANGTIDIGAYESQALPQGSRIFAVGGAPGRVQVRRGSDGALVTDFTPYGAAYSGGVAVAVGDVNGDGFADLVTAPLAGNPHVKVYDGKAIAQGTFNPGNPDASLLAAFFAYGVNFNVGATVAVGDISHDGFADLVTGASAGNPHVKVYDGKAIAQHTFDNANPDASLLAAFFAYGINFNVGANVAVGDVNHDGFADVVTGATAGNPHVKVYDGQAIARRTLDPANPDASLLAQWFAFGLQFNVVGAFVAVGDVTGNGFGDVIVGASVGNPQVKVYDGKAIANGAFNNADPDASLLASFFAYGLNFNTGASVAAAAFGTGGPADILTGAAQGAPHYRLVKGLSGGIQPPAEHGIDAIAGDFSGGILVGA